LSFVSHLIVLFLNERDVLNKLQQQDSIYVVSMNNFASEINYSRNFLRELFLGIMESQRKKRALKKMNAKRFF